MAQEMRIVNPPLPGFFEALVTRVISAVEFWTTELIPIIEQIVRI
jgi:hypothetical protein